MNIDPNSGVAAVKAAVTGAIRNAAQLTGADFRYLLATAQVESNLNPHSAAPTSSAKGLFQFITQTWLGTLKEQGPALGFAPYADAITRLPSGQYAVTDPKLHDRIMNLRSDPGASAVMAGAFTKANADKLQGSLGRPPTEGELYIAHFLGPNGAARLIELAQTRPQTAAAQVFPGPANANPAIFFDRAGQPRGAADVYRLLVGRYDVARANAPPAANLAKVAAPAANFANVPALAANFARMAAPAANVARAAMPAANFARMAAPVANVARAAMPAANVARMAAPAANVAKTAVPFTATGPMPITRRAPVPVRPMPDPVQPAQTHAAVQRFTANPVVENGRVFHSLFRTAEQPQPVSPAVSALWGTAPVPAQTPSAASVSPAAAPPAPQPAPPQRPASTLDLFRDPAPNVRSLFRGGA